jgi:peptidoglycan/LPS O-acetylase OafA/YrhL
MNRPTSLPCLDGLRGLAVLAVLLFHLRLMSEGPAEHSLVYRALAPTRFGHAGVNLFLVLSGFCLTHSLLRRSRQGQPTSLRGYFQDRLRRIAPPYYAAMLLYLAAWYLLPNAHHYTPNVDAPGARQVVYHALFVHGLYADTQEGIDSPFWSLSLEAQFYVVLPLLFVMTRRWGGASVLGIVVGLSTAWRLFVARSLPEGPHLINGFFLGRWAEFAAGMVVAFWHESRGREIPRPRSVWWLSALSLLGLVVAVGLQVRGGWSERLADYTFGAAFSGLLMAALLSAETGGPWRRLLTWRPLSHLGTISYSVYLMHSLVLALTKEAFRLDDGPGSSLGDVAFLTTSLAMVWLVGWSFHHLIERRFVRSIDRRPGPGSTPRSVSPRAPFALKRRGRLAPVS